jgi:preprotein translocase subunit SecG
MMFLLYTLLVLVCFFLILVILLQQGSGADLSVFGGGSTQTAFGARSASQVIHKLTVFGFVAFVLLTLTIAVARGPGDPTVMRGVNPIQIQPTPPEDAGGLPLEAPPEAAPETTPPPGPGAGEVEPEATDSGLQPPAEEP